MQTIIKSIDATSAVFEKLGIYNFNQFLFLALLGIITAIIAFIVDIISYNLIDRKNSHIY